MIIDLIKSENIAVAKLEINKGQIDGLPKNPRLIKNERYEKLKKSIQDNPEMLGMREVLVYPLGSKFIIIGGNMRFQACKELGFVTVPCKVLSKDTTAEQLRAITIKDNVGFGEHDWDSLANEWDSIELEDWGLEVPNFEQEETILEAEEDDYEEPENLKVDVVLGDLIEFECKDGRIHRLICGDSTQVDTWEKVMNKKLCDMVMTDPPYNVDYASKNKMLNYSDKGATIQDDIENDKMDNNSFYQFLYDFYTALGSFTKQGGSWYVWHTDNERINFTKAFLDSGMYFSQCLIWVKNNLVLGRLDYQKKHETCLYGWKEGAGHYFTNQRTNTTVIEDKLDIKKLTKEEMKKMLTQMLSDKTKSTVIHCDKPHQSDLHPTMKPILLLAPLIENSSKENEIVADGFLGSGSTMVASHQLNRKCYGMELDPKYCQVIIDRMQKLDSTIKVKINSKEYINTQN